MTEEEAKTKWCPMVRFVIGPQSAQWQEAVFSNRNEMGGEVNCIGSSCMMWKYTYKSNNGQKTVSGGYCGLAGQP